MPSGSGCCAHPRTRGDEPRRCHDNSCRILDMFAFAGYDCDAGRRLGSWCGDTQGHRRELSALSYRRYRPGARWRERLIDHDLDGARKAWIAARVGWERSEVFTSGFVPELDQKIDAWPDASHGFHGIEAMLFGGRPAHVAAETDALISQLADLRVQLDHVDLAPQRMLNGIARQAFEIGANKADGGESRLSGTSLNDLQSNADGIEASDPRMAAAVRAAIERLQAAVKIPDLRKLDAERLRADSEELVALLQMAAPKIGLNKPTLEEGAR